MSITLVGVANNPADNGALQGSTSGVTITPPGSMVSGDLVLMTFLYRNTGITFTLPATGGQSWTPFAGSYTLDNTANTQSLGAAWCIYNGTWSTDPSVANSSGTLALTINMAVFRKTLSFWEVKEYGTTTHSGGTVTGTGWLSSSDSSYLIFSLFTSSDDNTWGSLTGTGWSQTSFSAQYRNTQGNDTSTSFAYYIGTTSGTAPDTTRTQSALGPDPGYGFYARFSETNTATVVPSRFALLGVG